jgi:sarcosine oxidase subunit beta
VDYVVLAAGAWSAELAAKLGIDLPIEPLGLQAMTTEPAPSVLRQVITSVRRMISLKQLPDGRFLLGGGWPGEFSLDAPRGGTIPKSRAGNIDAAVGVLPAVAHAKIADAWLGIEAITVDEVPIIGPVDGIEGLALATGFCGHGFAISPAVGEAVADYILTGAIPPSLAELTFARFSRDSANSPTSLRAG